MRHLGVFAKYWAPGAVKTRLARSIGEQRASQLYRVFVHTTLHRFRDTADHRTIVYWPPESSADFERVAGNGWQLQIQRGTNLGERMANHFADVLGKDSQRAVLIGTDSPNLPIRFIDQALQALEEQSCVLGPTSDGGYYLIGLSQPVTSVFRDIDWSTSAVYEQTIAAAARHRLSVAELPEWYDIDDYDDLQHLARALSQAGPAEPQLQQLQDAVSAALADGSGPAIDTVE